MNSDLCYDQLLVDITSQGNVKFSMWVSFLEIYNESVYDLLEHVSKKMSARIPLQLKEDRNGMPYVKGSHSLLFSNIHVSCLDKL